MTKSSKSKIFNIKKKEQISTLELWQSHLRALQRASQERRSAKIADQKSESSEISTSEVTIRPR